MVRSNVKPRMRDKSVSDILLNTIINLFMVALLMTTIIYCWVLNRRIRILQDSKSELAQLLRYFDESTQRASDSIVALQSSSKRASEAIQHKLERSVEMLDDLEFMIEKGTKVCNQIDAALAVQRAKNQSPLPMSHITTPKPSPVKMQASATLSAESKEKT